MAKTMKAAVVRAFGQPLTIDEVPVPEVSDGLIQVAIQASGVCHTDLHAAEGTGTSSMVRGWPNARTTAAFIVFAMVFLLSDDDGAGMGAPANPCLDHGQKKPSFLAE